MTKQVVRSQQKITRKWNKIAHTIFGHLKIFLNYFRVKEEIVREIENVLNWFEIIKVLFITKLGLPCGSDGKESACNAGGPGLIPGSGGYPGEGNGNPLQYSCLENTMDRGAWWATDHGTAKSWTRLSN